MLRCFVWVAGAWVVAMILGSGAAWAQVAPTVAFGQLDDFEDGTTMGWAEGAPSPNPPMNISSGGPNGVGDAFLSNASSGFSGPGSKMVMFNQGRWTGNYSAAHVTRIEGFAANLGSQVLHLRITFESAVGSYGSREPIDLPPDGIWRPIVFDLNEASLGPLPGAGALSDALSAVTEVRLLSAANGPTQFGDSIIGTLGIDHLRKTGLAGDADFDGRVTFVDFQRLELGFGIETGATWEQGDFNFDGRVDPLDFNILRSGFGNGALAAGQAAAVEGFAAAHAVPEPSAALLLVVSCVVARHRRHQRDRS
jgi:hypothetical protein